MATQKPLFTITRIANADLSTKQYYFVELVAGNKVDVCNATTDIAIGVLQNNPKSGEEAVIGILGTTKVVAGAAITEGVRISPTAAGKAQATVATQFPRAIALDAAGDDLEKIEALLLPMTVMA